MNLHCLLIYGHPLWYMTSSFDNSVLTAKWFIFLYLKSFKNLTLDYFLITLNMAVQYNAIFIWDL